METVETLDKTVNKVTKNPEKKEGKVAKFIENQTAKVSSDIFLWASVTSMTASLVLKILKKDNTAMFVGQWAPTLLILGLYNKIVKVQGSER